MRLSKQAGILAHMIAKVITFSQQKRLVLRKKYQPFLLLQVLINHLGNAPEYFIP